MIFTFYITLYHGTDFKYLKSILEEGFKYHSCGTNRKEWASKFGNCLIKIKYPYKFNIKDIFWFLNIWLIERDLLVLLTDFKPKEITILKHEDGL